MVKFYNLFQLSPAGDPGYYVLSENFSCRSDVLLWRMLVKGWSVMLKVLHISTHTPFLSS